MLLGELIIKQEIRRREPVICKPSYAPFPSFCKQAYLL